MSHVKIIAVDFDGTLCQSCFPEIGAPNKNLIEKLKRVRLKGTKLILWTCRNGQYLTDAVEFCKKYGLEFDAINENIPENIKHFHGNYTRKVYANLYLDDHSMLPQNFELER